VLTNNSNHSFFHQMTSAVLYVKLVQYSYSELTIKLLKIRRLEALNSSQVAGQVFTENGLKEVN
jgi:hypothetical protein